MKRFTPEGWEDGRGDRHWFGPGEDVSSISTGNTVGLFIHVTDTDDREYNKYFWAWITAPGAFESWDEWYVYVATIARANYGIELADE